MERKKEKYPGFIFYPGDYLRDTQCLSEPVQVSYDRIMCEHMRNICITQERLKFFTKKLTPDEVSELKSVLTVVEGGYEIEWVATSVRKGKAYSDSRRKNREGKTKEDVRDTSKTYVPHMDIDIDIDTGIENENASESENGKEGVEVNPENIGSGGLPFQCRQIILQAWEGYQWELKDSQAVKRLIEKIKGVITDSQKRKGEIIGATDQSVIDFLSMLLQKLPKWYAERNRDVEGLDSKFNRIVNEIRNASGQQGSYDSLKRRLAEEIITATGNSR